MNSTIQSRIAWIGLFLFAAILWSVQISRPVDLPSWHEFDYASVARNFVHEGNNILFPRIDWRRDGPGFTEMEFPIHPWAMAQFYRAFGVHEIAGRLISYFATLLSLTVFCRFALQLLPEVAAWTAGLFFVISRETLYVASAIQPEALMLMFYLLAAYFFYLWYAKNGGWWTYAAAILAYSGAMLVKSPAAHLGLLFLFLTLKRSRARAFQRPELWFFAVASLAPVLLWYVHAYSLWTTYGNSMGVSNEDHWIGLDLLMYPKAFLGVFGIELVFVFGLGGSLVALIGVLKNRLSPAVQLALPWLAAIAIYYLVIIRTAGAYWAWYYHIVAVPPAALLFASGLEWLRSRALRVRPVLLGAVVALVPLVVGLHAVSQRQHLPFQGIAQDLLAARLKWAELLLLSMISLAVILLIVRFRRDQKPMQNGVAPANWVMPALGGAICIYLVTSAQLSLSIWAQYKTRTREFATALRLADKIPAQALIVTSGGVCLDPGGHRVAGDGPEMFYWLNRKGFSLCEDRQSIGQLREFAKRGATYFVAGKAAVRSQPNLEEALMRTLPLLDDGGTAWLFQLQP